MEQICFDILFLDPSVGVYFLFTTALCIKKNPHLGQLCSEAADQPCVNMLFH